MPRGIKTGLIVAPVLLALAAGIGVAAKSHPSVEFPCWFLPKGQVIVVPGADDCPLRFLDEIKRARIGAETEISLLQLRSLTLDSTVGRAAEANGSVSVELSRDGSREWVTVPVKPLAMTRVVSRVIGAFAIAAGLMWIPVFLVQRSNSPVAVPLGVFYSAAVVVAVVAACGRSSVAMSRSAVYALIVIPAALAHLSMVFPREGRAIQRAPDIARIPYFFSLGFAVIAALALDRNPILWRSFLYLLLALCSFAWGILLMACYFAIRESEAAIERSRARIVFYGTLLVPVVPVAALARDSTPAAVAGAYLWMAAVAMPLPIGLAISHYNLFDLGWDVRHWIARLLYFGSGALASALLVHAALGFVEPNQSLRDLGVLFAVALSCLVVVEALRRPMLGWLESLLTPRLDQLREHRERYSAAMVELRDEDAAAHLLSDVLERGLEARAGSVLLLRRDDWRPACLFGEDAPARLSLVAAALELIGGRAIVHLPLEADREDRNLALLEAEGVEIVASVGGGERLGLVLVGPNARNVPYSGIEVDFVAMAVAHAANAIRNARLADELVAKERHAATARVAIALMHDIGKDLGWIRRLVMRVAKAGPATHRSDLGMAEIRDLTDSVVSRMKKFMAEATEPRTDPPGVLRLDEMLDDALRRLRVRHGERRVHQSIDPEIRGLRCHENLGRVASNLVENGLQASAPDGMVHVSLSTDDAWLQLTVNDDGCGLADEALERAFEPGFTTRRSEGGSGVGLAVSRDIIEAMGGKIELQRVSGGGTCAVVRVPMTNMLETSNPLLESEGS